MLKIFKKGKKSNIKGLTLRSFSLLSAGKQLAGQIFKGKSDPGVIVNII